MKRPWAWPWELRRAGVIGLNGRNRTLVLRENRRHLYPLVDDKLRCKQLLLDHGLAVPPLLGVLRSSHDLKHFPEMVEAARAPHGFVIKPSRGSGGKGILVIARRAADGGWVRVDGRRIRNSQLHFQVENIHGGLFSLAGQRDVAMVEGRVRCVPALDKWSSGGVPDLRVVVYRNIPILAMLRVATDSSGGRANLHQGAIGIGIDLAGGRALHAVQKGHAVSRHPDSELEFAELEIPDWQRLLVLAAHAAELTGLNYLGVDIMVDVDAGPLVVELNARPGLAIQLANGCGLRWRTEAVRLEADGLRGSSPEDRVAWAQRRFGTG